MAAADVVVNGARSIETNLITGLGGTAPNYLAIGSGSTTAAAADTALTTEYTTGTWTGYARAHPTPTRTTTTLSNDTMNWSASWTAGATQAVFEAGLLDAVTAGNLFEHSSFAAAVNLSSGDSITVNLAVKLN
jgi:hypothetical protein